MNHLERVNNALYSCLIDYINREGNEYIRNSFDQFSMFCCEENIDANREIDAIKQSVNIYCNVIKAEGIHEIIGSFYSGSICALGRTEEFKPMFKSYPEYIPLDIGFFIEEGKHFCEGYISYSNLRSKKRADRKLLNHLFCKVTRYYDNDKVHEPIIYEMAKTALEKLTLNSNQSMFYSNGFNTVKLL